MSRRSWYSAHSITSKFKKNFFAHRHYNDKLSFSNYLSLDILHGAYSFGDSIFTALHGMQSRYSDGNSVCLSVCLSNACIVTKRKKNLSRFFYHAKEHSVLFYEKKNGWWGATPSILNFGSTGRRWSEIADFEPIIARSASAVRPSEKSSINTIRKSRTHFPASLRWSAYVAPKSPKGGLKTQKGRFSCIIELRLKKVCYKVSLCENCQRQSCRAFIGLTIHAKTIGGERPLLPKILGQCDRVGAKLPMFDLAPQR